MKNYGLWFILALPAAIIILQYFSDILVYGEALKLTGQWAAWLLLITLAISPLRKLTARYRVKYDTMWLLRLRRPLGVAVFGYSILHLIIYLEKKADIRRIASESFEWELLTGWIAFFIFLPLAVTSRDSFIRKLGRNWKKLHNWIYLGTILTALHWVLTAFDPMMAYIFSGIIIATLLTRFLKV